MTTVYDCLVIGGGVIGLAIALELKLRGASVVVITRNLAEAASYAAGGMLAPEAEQIPPSPMLDLCLRSRSLYPDWTRKLEDRTGLDTGYWSCGILSPVYELADAASHSMTKWCDRATVHQLQPGLSSDVIGGWWYPQDAQVDNRALTTALWTAARDAGVDLWDGVTVEQILHQQQLVSGIQTSVGTVQAGHYILTTGAWSQAVLEIPVFPQKGQMLSVQIPVDTVPLLPLQHVLFGDIYLIPRRHGQIVIGATSENAGFASDNTPMGVHSLLSRAMRLFPALQEFPIQELWWGFRPNTPDELPILGSSPYDNLTLATGHHRNGILLAPVTAEIITNWVTTHTADPLLTHFHWSRFSNHFERDGVVG